METIKAFFKDKAKHVSFIELKKQLGEDAKRLNIPGELPVPILTDELVRDIIEEKAQEEIDFKSLVKGMIYLLGSDPEFVYAGKYKTILYQLGEELEKFILWQLNTLENQKNIDESLVYSRGYVVLFEKSLRAHLNYGLYLEQKAQYFRGKKAFKEADLFIDASDKVLNKLLDLEPNYPPALYKLGYHAQYQKSFIRAKIFWEKFLAFNTDEDLEIEIKSEILKMRKSVSYEEGYQMVLRGGAKEGLEKLLPLYEENNDWWNLCFMIGLAYRQLEKYEEAIDYFEKAKRYSEDNTIILNELAISKASIGLEIEAMEIFNKAIEINKMDGELYANRGMLYLTQKKMEEARSDVEKALSIDPEDQIALAIKKQLNKTN